MNPISNALIFIFGLILGSFLNVIIYRLPRHESIVYPSSHCPYCSAHIKPYDNIPLLSYAILGGKCRSCGKHISLRYPFVELLAGLSGVAIYLKYGLGIDWIFLFVLSLSLITIIFIDLDNRIIPNVITYPGIVIGFAASFFMTINSVTGSVLGSLMGGGVLYATAYLYKSITKQEGMGMGDVKLMAMLGAFLGWQASLFIIITSAFAGSIAGIALMLFAGKNRKYAIPYGPFISLGAFIYLFYGQYIIQIYLRFIGYD